MYRAGDDRGGLSLTWHDRAGKSIATVGDTGPLGPLHLSPDRQRVAVETADPMTGNTDIWIYDVARGGRTRFTFDPAEDRDPVWSPDGRTIVFDSNRTGHREIYRKSSDGAGTEELLYADALEKAPTSWSSDGKYLLYRAVRPGANSSELWVLPLTPAQPGSALKPSVYQQAPGSTFANGQFSTDGQWVAYSSNESQRAEVYAAPFPGPGGKRQISSAGGFLPLWRHDGKELFYLAPDSRLMAAAITPNRNTIEIGDVRALFSRVITPTGGGYGYGVNADGQRFLTLSPGTNAAMEPLTLVQNWIAGLKK
jgi:Tol biopolymer transport system component